MKTVKPIIHWEELFNQNGIPHAHFQSIINEYRIPLSEHASLPIHSKNPHGIILWDQIIPVESRKVLDVGTFLTTQAKNKNGTLHHFSFNGIELPKENSDLIKKQLALYAGRERRRDPFGEWLWQEFQKMNFNIHALATLILNIKFELMYVKNESGTGIKKLDTLNIHHDDGGIYLVMEHAPQTIYHKVVYIGKSFGAMGTTMWCHLNEWGDKHHPGTRPRGSRGEDRGMWREKILEGYSYSVGTIKILPEKSGFPGITHKQLLDLETKLIQIFNPRDNIRDKLWVNENQVELFDNGIVEESEQSPTNQGGLPDHVPF